MSRNRSSNAPAIEVEVMLDRARRSVGKTASGVAKSDAATRTPRITRLTAMAIKYQGIVNSGELKDFADIARLGYVSRARITQIMNLSNLAPDIQEQLLFPVAILPPERRLREVVAKVEWKDQRRLWRSLLSDVTPCD